jgi:hypothetical protein
MDRRSKGELKGFPRIGTENDADAQAPEVVYLEDWHHHQPGLEVIPKDKNAGLEVTPNERHGGLEVKPNDAPQVVEYEASDILLKSTAPSSRPWFKKRRSWILVALLAAILIIGLAVSLGVVLKDKSSRFVI